MQIFNTAGPNRVEISPFRHQSSTFGRQRPCQPPEHLLNPSPYRLPTPSTTEASIMSGEDEINGFLSSPSVDETKSNSKSSICSRRINHKSHKHNTRPVLTTLNRSGSSSPKELPPARRLFQTIAKKPNREFNEDTLQSNANEANTRPTLPIKRNRNEQTTIALT